MKTLYKATDMFEAHMLADLLQREGLTAHILCEYLPGAISELPASGLVRLVIDEADRHRLAL